MRFARLACVFFVLLCVSSRGEADVLRTMLAAADDQAGGTPPPGQKCTDGKVLYEAPTGFWIVNPTAILDGNSIGGCQSLGKGYWYVAPRLTPGDSRYALKFLPVGRFTNNRVHGCYDGIFGETDAGTIVEQMQPKINGDNNDLNLIARFDGFTASRIRNRGVWMRPLWNVFDNARVSSSREDVSLVTSGGLDGNGPGVWGLLKNSVVVGWSRNNVDRWGPCPNPSQQEGHGCVDRNPTLAKLRRHSTALPETAVVPKKSLEGQERSTEKMRARGSHSTSTNSSKRPWLSCVRNWRCTGYRSIWISAKAFRG